MFIEDPQSWRAFTEHDVPEMKRTNLELKYINLIRSFIRIYDEPGERSDWRMKDILNKHINPEQE